MSLEITTATMAAIMTLGVIIIVVAQRPGGRDQGPPDLDEVFSKLSQKLGGKFGKKGGGGGSPIGGGGSAIGFGVIAVIAIAVWGSSLASIPSVKQSAGLFCV